MAEIQRYVILPTRGLLAGASPDAEVLKAFPRVKSNQPSVMHELSEVGVEARVVDTVAENGPKLVELTPEQAERINRSNVPVRALPDVTYPLPDLAESALTVLAAPVAPAAVTWTFVVQVVDSSTTAPIPNCKVVAFADFALRVGSQGFTDAAGLVTLTINKPTIERLLALPEPGEGYWSAYMLSVAAAGTIRLSVTPVTLPYVDVVRHYYGATNFVVATGVKVGVIDTGCGPHADLNIVGGRNTVTGEPANDIEDGHYHGTHVAGLIGGRGIAHNGIRGMAPGVPTNAYRVFGAGAAGASSYAILKAMIAAAWDQCDIINLSLGGGPYSEIVEEAVADARSQGMLVVVAAGNDGRAAVSYPAAYTGATAVSAMGRDGSIPTGAREELSSLRPPFGTADPDEYIADFSNIGPSISVTAPGVGTLSTLPRNRIGPLSGTSMAAPVAAGAAACLLSQDPSVHKMTRDIARSTAIERLLTTNCARRGFGLIYEGFGLPQSPPT